MVLCMYDVSVFILLFTSACGKATFDELKIHHVAFSVFLLVVNVQSRF